MTTLHEAIRRSLDFLDNAVGADGAWPCPREEGPETGGQSFPEHPPFAAGLAALALQACDDPRARALRARTVTCLMGRADYPGVWRYWPSIPPDMDDTAICSLAAPAHPLVLTGRNIATILHYRDTEGRFLTWMLPKTVSHDLSTEVDAVVNANVVAYLGDCPETQVAQRWVGDVIAEGREVESSPNYCSAMDVYLAVARARAPPSFSRLSPIIAERIRDRLTDGKEAGDIMRVAQGLSALDMLGLPEGDSEPGPIWRPAMDLLLEAQLPDGAWPACRAWRNPQRPDDKFGSKALTTVFCLEALARWAVHGSAARR